MSEERRRHGQRKRDWPSPPRQDAFGREGFHPGGRGGPPWGGKRGRVDPRVPWNRGGRGPLDNQRPVPPRFGGSRRGSPPPFDGLPHRGVRGPPAWSSASGPYGGPSGGADGSRGFSTSGESRGPHGTDRRLPLPPHRASGSWDGRHRDVWDRDTRDGRDARERDPHTRDSLPMDAGPPRLSSRETSPEPTWRASRLPPPPPRRSREKDAHAARDPYKPREREPYEPRDPRDRDPYSGITGEGDEGGRSSKSKWDKKPAQLYRTTTAPASNRDLSPLLPPPPPLQRTTSHPIHSPRKSSHRSSKSPPRKRRSNQEHRRKDAGRDTSGTSQRQVEQLEKVEDQGPISRLEITVPEPGAALEALTGVQMSPVTPRDSFGADVKEEEAGSWEADGAEAAAEAMKTPLRDQSGSDAGGNADKLHSNEAPRRKRLGWGQGLARLKSSDPRPSGEGDARSPGSDQRCATSADADADATKQQEACAVLTSGDQHTDYPNPFELASAQQVLQMDPATEGPNSPWQPALQSPDQPLRAVSSPVSASRPVGEAPETLASPFKLPAAALAWQSPGAAPMSPVSPKSPASSRPRSTDHPGSPPTVHVQSASVSSPRVRQSASGDVHSPALQHQASPEQQPSRVAILLAIEKADAEIEAKSQEIARLAAARDQATTRLQDLEDEARTLQMHVILPPDNSSSDEEISSTSEASSGSKRVRRLPNGIHKTRQAVDMDFDADEPSVSQASTSSSDSIQSVAAKPFPSPFQLRDLATQIFQDGRQLARTSRAALGASQNGRSEGQVYKAPHEFPAYQRTISNGERNKERFRAIVQEKKQDLVDKELAVTLEYRELHEQWREYFYRNFGGSKRLNTERLGLSLPRAASRRVAAARSEHEERVAFVQRTAMDRLHNLVLCLQIQDQFLDDKLREYCAFPTTNAIVEDPVAQLEHESALRPWSAEEKRIFMEKFLAYPKDFRTIASFLDHRSTADCVQFYYKTQKLDDFAIVRRKQQLKKRRLQSDANRNVTYMGVATSQVARGAAARAMPPGYPGRVTATAAVFPDGSAPGRGPRAPRGQPRTGRGRGSLAMAVAVSVAGGDATDQDMLQAPSEPLSDTVHSWSTQDEEMLTEGVRLFGRDFKAISKHMGYSRTPGACKSYFSKNRHRLGLDRVLAEHLKERNEVEDGDLDTEAQAGADELDDEPMSPSGHGQRGEEGDMGLNTLQDQPMDLGDAPPSPSRSQGLPLPPQDVQHSGAFPPGFAPPYFGLPGLGHPGPYQSLPFSGAQIPASGQLPMGQGLPIGAPGGIGMPGANQLGALLQMGMLQGVMPGFQGYPGFMGMTPQLLHLLMGAMGGANPGLPYTAQMPGFGGVQGPPFNLFGDLSSQVMMQALGGKMGLEPPPPLPQTSPAQAGPAVPAPLEQNLASARLLPEETTSSSTLRKEQAPPEDASLHLQDGLNRRSASLWSLEEKEAFMACFRMHGRDWRRLSQAVPNKTETQIKNYFQNYKSKLGLDRMELPANAIHPGQRRRRSDNTSPGATPSSTPPPGPLEAAGLTPPDGQGAQVQQLPASSASAFSDAFSHIKAATSAAASNLLEARKPIPVTQEALAGPQNDPAARFPEHAGQEPSGTVRASWPTSSGWRGSSPPAADPAPNAGIALQGRPQGYTIPAAQWRGLPQRQESRPQPSDSPAEGLLRGREEMGRPSEAVAGSSFTVQNVLSLLQSQKAMQAEQGGTGPAMFGNPTQSPELLTQLAANNSASASGAQVAAPRQTEPLPDLRVRSGNLPPLSSAPPRIAGRTITTGGATSLFREPSQELSPNRFSRYASAPADIPVAPGALKGSEGPQLGREDRFRSASQPLSWEAKKRQQQAPGKQERLQSTLARDSVAPSPKSDLPAGGSLPAPSSGLFSGGWGSNVPPPSASNEELLGPPTGKGAAPTGLSARQWGTAEALAALGCQQLGGDDTPSQLQPPGEWRKPGKQPDAVPSIGSTVSPSSFLPAFLQQAALMQLPARSQAAASLPQPQQPSADPFAFQQAAQSAEDAAQPAPDQPLTASVIHQPGSASLANTRPPAAAGSPIRTASALDASAKVPAAADPEVGPQLGAARGAQSDSATHVEQLLHGEWPTAEPPSAEPPSDAQPDAVLTAERAEHRDGFEPSQELEQRPPETAGNAVPALQPEHIAATGIEAKLQSSSVSETEGQTSASKTAAPDNAEAVKE